MRGPISTVLAANTKAVISGKNQILLDRIPFKGPNGGYTHVIGLRVVVTQCTLTSPSTTKLDGAFYASLIKSIDLTVCSNSPAIHSKKNGQLIKSGMSGFMALSALSYMTNAPLFKTQRGNFANNVLTNDDSLGPSRESQYWKKSRRDHKGPMHAQGPIGQLLASVPATNEFDVFLPVGQRYGEPDTMNGLPAGAFFLGTGGVTGACKNGGTPAILNIEFNSSSHGVTALFAGNIEVYAEIQELPVIQTPLIPVVTTRQFTQQTVDFEPGISGARILVEELSSTGDILLPNLTGLQQIQLTNHNGGSPYPHQDIDDHTRWLQSQLLNGTVADDWMACFQDGEDKYQGTTGVARYPHVGQVLLHFLGPSSSAPDFNKGCKPWSAYLLGVDSSIVRNLLEGYWLNHSPEYLQAMSDYTGTPNQDVKPDTGLSPADVQRGLEYGVPLKSQYTGNGC